MEKFDTGAFRSIKMPRYDLIPAVALERLAQRFTGKYDSEGKPDSGALKYGECNWMKGLPTSDVYNHIITHLINWADSFRFALLNCSNDMEGIKNTMRFHSMNEDDLAGAMWGICVLMHQEKFGMFHDTKFPSTPPPSISMGEFDPLNPKHLEDMMLGKGARVLPPLESGKCYKIISVFPTLEYEVIVGDK